MIEAFESGCRREGRSKGLQLDNDDDKTIDEQLLHVRAVGIPTALAVWLPMDAADLQVLAPIQP